MDRQKLTCIERKKPNNLPMKNVRKVQTPQNATNSQKHQVRILVLLTVPRKNDNLPPFFFWQSAFFFFFKIEWIMSGKL